MTLFERIKFLAEKQGKSINDVERELKYSQNTLYRLKRTNPSAKKLEELADYFDVSTDYLLGRTDDKTIEKPVDIEDDHVIMTYQGKPIPEEDMEIIKRLLRGK
ncbi:MAG: helix-turn-helix domain-containing protein [Lentilactobacillus diolivorans]|nr:helix-turn-helix domain-containing protein [Lentilactobacillus diolivorans]